MLVKTDVAHFALEGAVKGSDKPKRLHSFHMDNKLPAVTAAPASPTWRLCKSKPLSS